MFATYGSEYYVIAFAVKSSSPLFICHRGNDAVFAAALKVGVIVEEFAFYEF